MGGHGNLIMVYGTAEVLQYVVLLAWSRVYGTAEVLQYVVLLRHGPVCTVLLKYSST